MYRLHWKLQQLNNTSLLNSHHRQHSVPNKEGSHSTSADTQSCLRLQGCQEEHLCARQHTKLALFLLLSFLSFLLSPFLFPRQYPGWLLGKEMVFHSPLYPFYLFVCLFHTTVIQLHLPSTIKFKSWKHSKVYFLISSEFRLVITGRMLTLKVKTPNSTLIKRSYPILQIF